MSQAPANPFSAPEWLQRQHLPAPLADRIARVATLARCRDSLARGELPDEADRKLLVEALGRWFAGEQFDAAAKVQPKQGSRKTVQLLYREVCGVSSNMWNLDPNSNRVAK